MILEITFCHTTNLGCHSKLNSTSIKMKPNEVYGVSYRTDGSEIVTTPNEVYGVTLQKHGHATKTFT